MSNGVRGRGIIDLRKRRVGEPARAARARARAALASLPLHRRTSLRARRRKLQALLALVVLVSVAGAVYGLGELSYSSRYSITDVRVEGTEKISPRIVQAYVETKLNDGTRPILSNHNIFLYPKDSIAEDVRNFFPRVLSAQISRESLLAQAITVSVVERSPYALWCKVIGNRQESIGNGNRTAEKECFEMDDTGFVFAPADVGSKATTTGAVVFEGGLIGESPIGQTFLPEQFAGVLAFLSRLKDERLVVLGVSVVDEQDYSVSLAGGFVIRVTFNQESDSLVRNLKLVLSSESLREKGDTIEYIDLRFGNHVYYKNRQ